jgi:hypothetical protein
MMAMGEETQNEIERMMRDSEGGRRREDEYLNGSSFVLLLLRMMYTKTTIPRVTYLA